MLDASINKKSCKIILCQTSVFILILHSFWSILLFCVKSTSQLILQCCLVPSIFISLYFKNALLCFHRCICSTDTKPLNVSYMSALKYVFACEYGLYYFLYACNLKFKYWHMTEGEKPLSFLVSFSPKPCRRTA